MTRCSRRPIAFPGQGKPVDRRCGRFPSISFLDKRRHQTTPIAQYRSHCGIRMHLQPARHPTAARHRTDGSTAAFRDPETSPLPLRALYGRRRSCGVSQKTWAIPKRKANQPNRLRPPIRRKGSACEKQAAGDGRIGYSILESGMAMHAEAARNRNAGRHARDANPKAARIAMRAAKTSAKRPRATPNCRRSSNPNPLHSCSRWGSS